MREKRYSGQQMQWNVFTQNLQPTIQHQESQKFQTALCINLVYASVHIGT